MSGLISPRELRLRKVRHYFNLDENSSAETVFERCAKELGIPCAHDSARADAGDEKNLALDLDPPYFSHFLEKAVEREKEQLQYAE